MSLLFILQVLETVVNGIENMGGESLLFSHVLKCTSHSYFITVYVYFNGCMHCAYFRGVLLHDDWRQYR